MTGNRSDPARRSAQKAPRAKVASQATLAEPSAEQVARFLRRHPSFLAEHPDLLDSLDLPERETCGEAVVDFQSIRLERLGESHRRLQEAHDELLHSARVNMAAQTRIHHAMLELLSAPSFEHLIETVTSDLPILLDIDAVTLGVEQASGNHRPTRINGVFQLPPGTIQALLGPGKDLRLRADIIGEPLIFGSAAGIVRSDALLRLEISSATPTAVLALGARDPQHFHPGQATELLGFLARTLEHIIRAWLELPE